MTRDRTRRTGFADHTRRAVRYSAGRLRTASASRLTASKLPDLPAVLGIGGRQQIDETSRRLTVLPRVVAGVEVGDPAGPRIAQPGRVAHLCDDLGGGPDERPRS